MNDVRKLWNRTKARIKMRHFKTISNTFSETNLLNFWLMLLMAWWHKYPELIQSLFQIQSNPHGKYLHILCQGTRSILDEIHRAIWSRSGWQLFIYTLQDSQTGYKYPFLTVVWMPRILSCLEGGKTIIICIFEVDATQILIRNGCKHGNY